MSYSNTKQSNFQVCNLTDVLGFQQDAFQRQLSYGG